MAPAAKEKEKKDTTGRRKPGRVPTSCAECRRLKLRCDKKVPCEKCVSRGCGAICPDGSLTTGKGNRLVLANTEELHERIDALCSRIRELEGALNVLQMQVSQDPHPLLTQELLQLKAPTGATVNGTNSNSSSPSNQTSGGAGHQPWIPSTTAGHSSESPASSGTSASSSGDMDERFIDSFGTLSISSTGESTFLGRTARSEFLIRALSKAIPTERDIPSLPAVLKITNCTDAVRPDEREIETELLARLPPLGEAIRLCEIYIESGYLYPALPRAFLFDSVLSTVYRAQNSSAFTSIFSSLWSHHSLALLLSVFSIACLFDTTRTPYNDQAHEYYLLARATVALHAAGSRSTVWMVQTTLHLAQYLEMSDWQAVGSNTALPVVGHAVRLGVSIGLHLDGKRWKLPHEVQQHRNRVFWSVFAHDTWISFAFGRPPNLSPSYIDCPLPEEPDGSVAPNEARQTAFHIWHFQYSAFMHHIMEAVFGASNPSYHQILAFDRKIRDFPVPVPFQLLCGRRPNPPEGKGGHESDEYPDDRGYHESGTNGGVKDADPPAEIDLPTFFLLVYKEMTLLHLHRAYFAQALLDMPTLPGKDLGEHRYLPSVMATYRSAWRLFQGLKGAWRRDPNLLDRYGPIWSTGLSSVVVMCILVTRAPGSKMTKSALAEIDEVAALYQDAAPTCKSAANKLDIILSLQRKAHEAVDNLEPNGTRSSSGSPNLNTKTFTHSELDGLSGRTQLVTPNNDVPHPIPESAPTNGVPSCQLTNPYPTTPAFDFVHPTIASDMRNLQTSNEFAYQPLYAQVNYDLAHNAASSNGNTFLDSPFDVDMGEDSSAGAGTREMYGYGQPAANGVHPVTSHPSRNNGSMNPSQYNFESSSFAGVPEMSAFDVQAGYSYPPHSNAMNGAKFGINGYGGRIPDIPGPDVDATWQSFVEQLGF